MEASSMAASIMTDVRRGCMAFVVMCLLEVKDHAYHLSKRLKDGGFRIESSTLYPLLRRLEKLGLLASTWITDNKSKKVYSLTPFGQDVLRSMKADWTRLRGCVDGFVGREESP